MAGIFSDKALGSQFSDPVVVWFVISSVDYIGQMISGKSVLGTSLRKRADQIDYIIINLTMDSSLVRAVIRPAFIVKSLGVASYLRYNRATIARPYYHPRPNRRRTPAGLESNTRFLAETNLTG